MLAYRSILRVAALFALYAAAATVALAEDWLPIAREQLDMRSEPKAPGAPAIYLYRQVDRDDRGPSVAVYARIKILTEAGRKYADVVIPYDKRTESVRGIAARTIRPDGSIVEFDGTIYDNSIVRGRGVRVHAKTFTLPDVQIGSIIEYRFRHYLESRYVFDSRWLLSEELFTTHAKFSLVPHPDFMLRYSWPMGLPAGAERPKKQGDKIRLEAHDVPAFVTEDYMPPPDELRYRVEFIYEDGNFAKEPVKFWSNYGKEQYRRIQRFVNEPRVMKEAVAQIVDVNDSPEIKLRKIYARTQQLRNLSFDRAKSEQEIDREKRGQTNDVADVWKQGYGDGIEITWLFLAFARAAGFEADAVLVSTRNRYFFDEPRMNPGQLNSNVVVVKLNGKDLYLDPGTAYVPFGSLPWTETAVKGLRLTKDGGAWVATPLPAPSESRTVRKATLRLGSNGSLEGKVTVTYSGLEALWRRIEALHEDDAARAQFLEDDIESDIPSGIEVKLTNRPAWESSEPTLVAEYDLKVPGWAMTAGQRVLLPVGLFSGGEKEVFKHSTRVHPLYFSFPSESEDEITIELPARWQASSLPKPYVADKKLLLCDVRVENKEGSLLIKRTLRKNILILDANYYPQVRDFFQSLRAHDEEQVVISSNATAAR